MQFPNSVESKEPIARYLLEGSKYSVAGMRVKHSAFMPANDNVLSVYRTRDLQHTQIIDIGQIFVAEPQARVVLAYASVVALIFLQQGLKAIPTAQPHPRHVDVSGWSDREANRLRAQIIAEHATLVLK